MCGDALWRGARFTFVVGFGRMCAARHGREVRVWIEGERGVARETQDSGDNGTAGRSSVKVVCLCVDCIVDVDYDYVHTHVHGGGWWALKVVT